MIKNDKFSNALFIIAIVIMIIGCGLLIREYNMCQNPIENIVVPHLEKEGITDYELIQLNIYQSVGDIAPVDIIKYYSDSYVPKNTRRSNQPVFNESSFDRLINNS
jgi:hypothetical protein|tara:strand:+ start:11540 stop:11857 length:318 start_codon:yes stop_codon:yes gene_type:complete